MRLRRSLSLAVALGALAGCGSQSVHELPPAAEPPRSPAAARVPAGTVTAIGDAPEGVVGDAATAAVMDGGRRVAVVSARERRLDVYDTRTRLRIGRAPAGLGPTHVACLDGGPCYVADTRGDALLVFSVGAGVEPTRRYGLPGGPYGLALDRARRRLYVSLPGRNELVALVAHGRPHVVARWPTVRQPDSVTVDEGTGDVFVTGRADGVLEHVTP
jgi:DNA-binding beta-propeller fold protein YncE